MVATIYESILLDKGYDLTEKRQNSSRVKKSDIDHIKRNGSSNTEAKHMEMYHMGQQENNNGHLNVKAGEHQIEKSTRNLNFITRALICFGLRSNMKAICSVDRPESDALTCVHGMRLFSLLWTVLVHTYLQLFAVGENRVIIPFFV